MLELDLEVHKTHFNTKLHLEDSFYDPIIFYLRSKNDRRNFLISFVIMDFQRKEITYLHSYSEENKERVEKYDYYGMLYSLANFRPHAIIRFPGKSNNIFFNFVERGKYFYRVDIDRNKITIFTGQDLPIPGKDRIINFGATFYADDEDPNFFYFSALFKINEEEGVIRFFRASLDLQKVDFLYEQPGDACPHVTRKYKNTILNSKFSNVEFKHTKSGDIFNIRELYTYVFGKLFDEFCELIVEENSPENFNESVRLESFSENYILRPDFELYIKSIYGDRSFLEICNFQKDCRFIAEKGIITLYDLKTKELKSYETSIPTPAHFETDSQKDIIYVSSHNFVNLDKRTYFGPAAIDRFKFKNNELKYEKSFSHAKGFRFTSHKVFYFEGKPYVCTTGRPNRLFIIDGEKMTLHDWCDIGKDFLSDIDENNITNYLNQLKYDPKNEVIALEVSNDGKYILIIYKVSVVIYSMKTKRIVEIIPYLFSSGKEFLSSHKFEVHVTHCQRFA